MSDDVYRSSNCKADHEVNRLKQVRFARKLRNVRSPVEYQHCLADEIYTAQP
jgi:hypothetical protein